MSEQKSDTKPYDPDAEFSFDRLVTPATSAEGTLPDGGKISMKTPVDIGFLSPPMKTGELGRLGGYRILEILGQGGMGLVFRAEDPHLQRPVAIKVMRPQVAANPQAAERFLREARAAAAVKHDHIVTIYQVGQDRGVPFIALEFLRGEPLDARLKHMGRLPAYEAMRIGHEVAIGLAAAHAAGLVHRDIKPANVWLEAPKGRVKILDFGLARLDTDDVHLTGPGAVLGTPAYMSPEQADGKPVDHRSDLFSLGVLLYRMLTGVQPFAGSSTMAILTSLMTKTPKPPIELVPECPTVLNDLILRLLAKDPDERRLTAQEVADTLAPALATVTVVQYAPTTEEHNTEFEFDNAPTEMQSTTRSSVKPAPPRKPWGTMIACGVGALLTILLVGWIIVKFGRPTGNDADRPSADSKDPIAGDPKNKVPERPKKPAPKKEPPKVADATPLPTLPLPKLPAGPSALDALDSARIPESERPDYLPKETVAVIGSHERRTWGMSPFGLSGGLAYSPDGKYLATVDFLNLYVYDAATMKLLVRQPYSQYGDTQRAFAFSPDSRTIYSTKQLHVWDLSRGGLKQVLDPALNKLYAHSLATSPDGKWLAYAGNSAGECGIVDLTAAGTPTVITWKTTGVGVEVAFSPDSNWLLQGDGAVGYQVCRRIDGKWTELPPIKRGNRWGLRVAYSFTAKRKLAYVLATGTMVPVDLSGAEPNVLDAVPGLDALVDFAIDSTGEKWAATRHDYLKTGAIDLILGDWDGDKLRETKRVPLPHVGYVAFAPDGKSVATHGYDRAVHIWDITGEKPVLKHQGEHPRVDHIAISPDGALAASVAYGLDGDLTLWTIADGQFHRKASLKAKRSLAGSFWIGNTTLVTQSHPANQIPNGPCEYTLWDATPDGLKERTAFTAANPGWKFAVTPDGTRLLESNTLWDLTAMPPKPLATFVDLSKTPVALGLSPDGKWIAAAASESVQLFDASKPEAPPVATGPNPGAATALVFAPDGASFVTVASSGLAQRWERKGAELVSTLTYTGIGYHTTNATFSPDGSRVYFGNHGSLYEFDAKLGTVNRTWSLPGWCHVHASADGRHVWTQNGNGTNYILRVEEAAKPDAKPMPERVVPPPPEKPFAQLDPAQIPAENRPDFLPKSVVAVFGSHARKHWSAINGVAVSPDGKLAASSGFLDGQIRLYDAATMTEKAVWSHPTPYLSVRFLSDSRLLMWNQTEIIAWDITMPKPVAVWTLPGGASAVLKEITPYAVARK
jgi:serine/threonine protein kinase/DNA-binding beta-propeller fold protein YncE